MSNRERLFVALVLLAQLAVAGGLLWLAWLASHYARSFNVLYHGGEG